MSNEEIVQKIKDLTFTLWSTEYVLASLIALVKLKCFLTEAEYKNLYPSEEEQRKIKEKINTSISII